MPTKLKELKKISDALDKREQDLARREHQLDKKIKEFAKRTRNYKLGVPIKHG